MSDPINATAQVLLDSPSFKFGSMDYVVFSLVLSLSAAIGVYFGFFDKSADTTDEYLMGGKRMKTLPIAISLVASQLSAISIMTIPAEMYGYGLNYFLGVTTMLLIVPMLNYVIIPVFYNNNITNCYEYLELRFNKATRKLQTLIFVLAGFLMLPIFMFLPSLAFAQVTGYNVHFINTIVCSICVFYTLIGGIKAVVWTDVVQAGIMIISVIVVGFLGASSVGGFGEVLRIAGEGGRLELNYTFDMTTRATVWNTVVPGFLAWASYVGFNQSCVQRIVSLPSLAHARRSLVLFGLGFLLIMSLNCFTGFVMYARYHDCDPLTLGKVSKLDKMVPYFVEDIVGHLPGMPGLFISCVFSAALSTLSANINALSGIAYFSYIKPHIRHTEHKANVIMKLLVFVSGVFCIFGGIFVERFTSILQIAYSIAGVTLGSVFGVFMLGILVPRAHGRAAFIGNVVAIACMIFISVGSWGRNVYPVLPTSIDNCPGQNATLMTTATTITSVTIATTTAAAEEFSIFNLSFNWYALIGFIITWLVSVPLSYMLQPAPEAKFDPKLLSPIIKPFVVYAPTPGEELPDLKLEIKK